MANVTFKGNPVRLEGEMPKVGNAAPDFTLSSNDLGEVSLKDFAGSVLVLVSVPSIDTPVCDLEGRRFNEEAPKLSDKVKVIIVSRDLPFAQARWCAAAGIKNVQTLSDYLKRDFGHKYGVDMIDLGLLARAIFVVDEKGKIAYSQLVPEVSSHPDYEAALAAIREVVK